MKRIVLTMGLFMAINCVVLADGNAFTPLDFDDTQYGTTTQSTSVTKNDTYSSQENEAVGNSNIQNAIMQLDNAQVDIRNDLLNCKTKYADTDAQYQLIKNERKALKKQVNSIEKRIKEIDRAKEKIRKNMM